MRRMASCCETVELSCPRRSWISPTLFSPSRRHSRIRIRAGCARALKSSALKRWRDSAIAHDHLGRISEDSKIRDLPWPDPAPGHSSATFDEPQVRCPRAMKERLRAILRAALPNRSTLLPLQWWTPGQWLIAAATCVVLFVVIGEVGQTLPPTSSDRTYPIEWWNYLTLFADSALMGLVVGTFLVPAGHRVAAAGGSGFAGSVAAIVMACPVCSPLAIPLLGAGGALSFLRGDRALLALLSVLALGLTLVLRLNTSMSCPAVPSTSKQRA